MSSVRVGHPHHRPPEPQRGGGDRGVLVLHTGLAAESSTDLRCDEVQLGGRDAEHAGQLAVDVVRELVRRPHGEPSVRPGSGGEAVRLHRRHGDALVDVAAAHHDVGDGVEVDRGVGRFGDGDVVAAVGEQHGRIVSRARLRHRRPTATARCRRTRRPRHRRPRRAISANTTATGSPTNRTRSVASGGRAKSSWILANPWCGATARSSAVHTAATPGMSAASLVSIERDRAVGEIGAHEHGVQRVDRRAGRPDRSRHR